MLESSFRLGRIAGVEIGVNISLLLIAGLLTISMTDNYANNPDLSDLNQRLYLLMGVTTALLFFFSILWHEMAHALMAKFYRIPVRRIVLFIFGGMAEIEQEPKKASQEFWIALIGPISSVVLGGIFWGAALLAGTTSALGVMLAWLGRINGLLTIFNMIPGFPLDGGRVLRAVIWFFSGDYLKATRIAVGGGQLFALVFVGVAAFDFLQSGDLFGSIWMLFIAWFLWSSATGHLNIAKLQNLLKDIPVGQLVANRVRLSPDWSVVYAIDVMSMGGPMRVAPVMKDNQMIGIFALDSVLPLPRFSWGSVRVANLMKSSSGLPSVSADTDLFETLRQMELKNADYMLVTNDSEPMGIVGRHDLMRFAERRQRAAQA